MKKIFTFALAALIATAATAQSPKTVNDGKMPDKTVMVNKNARNIGTAAEASAATMNTSSATLPIQKMVQNMPVLPKTKGAAVAAPIDDVAGNYKIKSTSALSSGATVNGTKLTLVKKSATELTIKGLDEAVDIVGTYADGVLTIPATYLYKNTRYDKDVYWGAWDTDATTYKESVNATWNGEAFEFDANEYIGSGAVGLGYFSLDRNMTWVVDAGAVNADISEILGSYIIQATSALSNDATQNGTAVTISQGSADNEVVITGWGSTSFTPITATYANGVLTINKQLIYSSATNGDLYFGEYNATTKTLEEQTTAEWTGEAFEFKASALIGGMWVTSGGFNFLDRSVSLVKKPDGDYTATLTLPTRTFADNKGQCTVEIGGDAAAAKMIVIGGDFNASLLNDYVSVLGTDVEPGTMDLDLSTQDPGIVTVYLATLDDNNKVVESVAKWVWVQDYSNDNWNSLGNATYTDDIFYGALSNLIEHQGEKWNVEVQQSKTDATSFRLVNLFGAQSGWQDTQNDPLAAFNHYINYNISAEGVEIELSPLGMTFATENGDGFIETLNNGEYKDNIITFPQRGLLFAIADGVEEGSGWYGNTGGLFKLELPGQLTVNVKNDGAAAAGATITVANAQYTTGAEGNAVINIDAAGDKSYDVTVALGSGSKSYTVDFKKDGKAVIDAAFGTTAINNITSEKAAANAPVYNLIGQRVSENAKGLLIKNGKKIINK